MKKVNLFHDSIKASVAVIEILNIVIGMSFVVAGLLMGGLNYNKLYYLICLLAILNVLFGIFIVNYKKVINEYNSEIKLINERLGIEEETRHQQEEKELEKIRRKNEEQLVRLRNPFSVGDNVKNKLNIYSKETGDTIPSGTLGKVVEATNDNMLVVKFVIDGKKVLAKERIDIFKKIY